MPVRKDGNATQTRQILSGAAAREGRDNYRRAAAESHRDSNTLNWEYNTVKSFLSKGGAEPRDARRLMTAGRHRVYIASWILRLVVARRRLASG